MIIQARLARPVIVLNGKDFFSSLAPYFLNCTYTDNCDGEQADDFQLQLADRDRKFINEWAPDIGVMLDASIQCERWFSPNGATLNLDCGQFWIDSLDFDLPQHTVSVKATSIPTDAHLKANNETRGWEETDLQNIVNQIAGENGMSVDWQAKINPKYSRVEQTEESGLCFIKKRAQDAKLAIKVHRRKIVVFDEQDYEAAPPKFTLVYGNVAATPGLAVYRMTGGHFSTKVTDTQAKATVSHLNPDSGMNTQAAFTDPDVGSAPSRGSFITGANKKWNQNVPINPEEKEEGEGEGEGGDGGDGGGGRSTRADGANTNWNQPSSAAGERRAKAEVRNANKDRETASIDMAIGNPLIAAGMTFMLVGVGQFDGKWFVTSAQHTVGPMYDTKLSIRRCLEGY